MTNSIDFILTTAANEIIFKVLSGKTLNFTRMAVGDGFSYDINAAKNYTALVNEVLSLDITKIETSSLSSVRVTSAFKNTDAEKEFYYREVGLYAQDPDTGKEILYAYGNRNDAAELITPTGSSVISKQLNFIISVGDSANVTFNVNAGVYALQEDVTTLQTSLHELNSTKAKQSDLEVERARINNLATLKEGSTTGDAELIDGHVDDFGNTHENIGTAFRTRANQLHRGIECAENKVATEINAWISGKYIATNGEIGSLVVYTENTGGFLYQIVECKANDIFRIKGVGGATPKLWCFVDANNQIVKRASTDSDNIVANNYLLITAPCEGKLICNCSTAYSYGLKKIDYITREEYTSSSNGIKENSKRTVFYEDKFDKVFNSSLNIIDSKSIVKSCVISTSGEITENYNYKTSDYISVGNQNKITFAPFSAVAQFDGVYAIAFYDKTKAFIKRVTFADEYYGKGSCTCNIVENSYYVRIIMGRVFEPPFAVFGSELKDYEDYSIKLNKSALPDDINEIVSPYVKFDFSNVEMIDVSSDVAKIDYVEGKYTILEQVYQLFDALVSSYHNYVTRVDCAEITGLSYPEYANGINTQGTYKVTPKYRTYMYKFECANQKSGNGNTGTIPKKKLFIVAGTHGNELAAPFNVYLFAKQLCECKDKNIFMLRSAFDVYIVPCLNGYGMYHEMRANGNLVNINRNYPFNGWVVDGENTKTDEPNAMNNYTGASAGSEFETQIVMKLTELINPQIAIDHHNYGNGSSQFYSEIYNEGQNKLCYQALCECSYAFKQNYPEYFGSGWGLLQEQSDGHSSPGYVYEDNEGKTSGWWSSNGVSFPATIEISHGITYYGGVNDITKTRDTFGNTTFSVSEYTLRLQLLKYCQWVLDNASLN